MKTSSIIFAALTAVIFVTVSAIPIADDNGSKSLTTTDIRSKRSDGWGYYYDNPARFSRFAASSSFAAGVPQYSLGGTGAQSYVWQSTPDYTYSIHQRHPLIYRNYAYYPNSLPYVTNAWQN